MLVGAHVSVAHGYEESLVYARSVGCECIQVFAKSPRQWRASRLDEAVAARFIAAREAVGFGPVFTHTAYLINLSTDNDELREKSTAALADELRRGSMLGAAGVVTHIGNDPGAEVEAAATRAGESVRRAFELAGGETCRTRLLLENTAGAGRSFGGSFEEIALVMEAAALPSHRLGMCLDTCHAFAYGMAVNSAQGWVDVVGGLAETVGIDRLGLIHANDCMFVRGSHRDRHAWIGDGLIGAAGFEAMMCEPALRDISVVTEMPGEVPEKDAINVGRLQAMREGCHEA